MARIDARPEREARDNEGTTLQFNGTVGTTEINVPSSPGNLISEFIIECMERSPTGSLLYVSLDGGTTFKTLSVGDVWCWTPKGNILQLKIKGSQSGVMYESVINTEEE